MKDVSELLKEVEEIEKQEIESESNPQPTDKGLLEKKRKLHATIHRVAAYYVRSYVHCNIYVCVLVGGQFFKLIHPIGIS